MKGTQKTKFSQAKSIWYTAKAFHHTEIFFEVYQATGYQQGLGKKVA